MPEVMGTRLRFWFTIRGMPVSVNLQTVHHRKLAAVRREVAPGAVGSAWGPAVSKVWNFIRGQPGLWTDGHNIFLYHHTEQPGAPILCDFGVEVTRTFETAGEVYATETPGGEAAVAVYRGRTTAWMKHTKRSVNGWRQTVGRPLVKRGRFTAIRRLIRRTPRRRLCDS